MQKNKDANPGEVSRDQQYQNRVTKSNGWMDLLRGEARTVEAGAAVLSCSRPGSTGVPRRYLDVGDGVQDRPGSRISSSTSSTRSKRTHPHPQDERDTPNLELKQKLRILRARSAILDQPSLDCISRASEREHNRIMELKRMRKSSIRSRHTLRNLMRTWL